MHLRASNACCNQQNPAKRTEIGRSLPRRSFTKFLGLLAGFIPSWAAMTPAALAATRDEVSSAALPVAPNESTRRTATYRRLKAYLDFVPGIDTHSHLHPFSQIPGYVETQKGRGMNLFGIWNGSYLTRISSLTPWKPGESFDEWWTRAKKDFTNLRATDFYRYMATSFQELYQVDFDRITEEGARKLDEQIFENYQNQNWLYHVITERANIELMFVDPFWARLNLSTAYPFQVPVFNVSTLTRGFHPSEFQGRPFDDPYTFAREHGFPAVKSLEDYLTLLDHMFTVAKEHGAACLKTTAAYERTLQFDEVPKERAERAFGRLASELTSQEKKEFEDFIMWRLVELSAKHSLPFQIHTGDAGIQGSNPMLLVNLLDANPHTKFILFHGGYPWIGETGAIVQKYTDRVWIDSVWLPTISYTMAKRAYHEWLDVMPSNRIMWGSDDESAEGIFGETELTRRCLAEVLAEKVDHGNVPEWYAQQIGKQILRDNALELFPQLKERLWKGKAKTTAGAKG